jgi:hypothetical protein
VEGEKKEDDSEEDNNTDEEEEEEGQWGWATSRSFIHPPMEWTDRSQHDYHVCFQKSRPSSIWYAEKYSNHRCTGVVKYWMV